MKCDICYTNLGWPDYAPLYERGYLPSLSESAVLTEFVEGLHPAIRAAVEKDGALVALPLELSVEAPAYNPAAFFALGLTDEDVPTTWPEFLALLARIPALTEGTDYTAFGASLGGAEDLQYMVFHELLQAYELYLEQEPGRKMQYDTPILRAALAAYEEVDFSALGGAEDWAEPDFDWALAHALFALPDSFSCDRRFTTFQVMPLSLAGGMAPMLRGKLDVAILNPDSPNRAAALRYLETALEGMPPLIRADMDAGWDAPIKFEGVDASISQAEERIAQLEAELERASADDKAEYQTMLDGWRESLARDYEAYWAVSEEDVRAYQAHAPDIRIWRHFGLDFDGLEALSAERSRYLAGEIDAETLLQNMDKKVNMMLLEN